MANPDTERQIEELTPSDEDQRDQLLFDVTSKRLSDEQSRTKELDNKASNIVSFVSIIVTFLSGLGIIKFSGISQLDDYAKTAYFIGIMFFLASIIISLFAYRIIAWSAVPNTENMILNYKDKPFKLTQIQLTKAMSDATVDTVMKNNNKASWVSTSWYLLVIGLAVMLLFVGYVFAVSG